MNGTLGNTWTKYLGDKRIGQTIHKTETTNGQDVRGQSVSLTTQQRHKRLNDEVTALVLVLSVSGRQTQKRISVYTTCDNLETGRGGGGPEVVLTADNKASQTRQRAHLFGVCLPDEESKNKEAWQKWSLQNRL